MEIVGFGVKSVGYFFLLGVGCLEGFNWSVLYNVIAKLRMLLLFLNLQSFQVMQFWTNAMLSGIQGHEILTLSVAQNRTKNRIRSPGMRRLEA